LAVVDLTVSRIDYASGNTSKTVGLRGCAIKIARCELSRVVDAIDNSHVNLNKASILDGKFKGFDESVEQHR
jgi:hypothetical protein